ncbi:MAG: hypothetical protein MN733_22155 [Nitrososphaera sp.]|nr:hypothetical protein [Nitrososphaera sp.]
MEMLTGDQFLVRPDQCVLAFGIPVAERTFREDLRAKDKDFAKQFQCWGKYYREVVSTVEQLEPILRQLGVSVIRDISLRGFGELFGKPDVRVITLFSHWLEAVGDEPARVEFADGLKNISSIVHEIPESFTGIMDLCACHPEELATALRKNRPRCLVKHTQIEATPSLWLHFYRSLFTVLHSSKTTYFEAITKVISEFVKVARQRGCQNEKHCG